MDDSVFCTRTNSADELTVIDMASTKSILLDTPKLNRNILPRKNLYNSINGKHRLFLNGQNWSSNC